MSVVVAIDVEKAGRSKASPIVAIGLVVARTDNQDINAPSILLKKTYNMENVTWPSACAPQVDKYPDCQFASTGYGSFEQDCWNDFWTSVDQDVLVRYWNGPYWSVDSVMGELWNVVRPYNVEAFVSDNPYFDLASIDYQSHLEYPARFVPDPLSSSGFKYTPVDDISYYDKAYAAAKQLCVHDHDPSNDAYQHYVTYAIAHSIALP